MGKKIKILYVDDENINIKLFEISFSRTYTVLTANNPIKGLEILSNHDDIDIVFSDMDMPFFNGVQFIQEAKKMHPNIKYYRDRIKSWGAEQKFANFERKLSKQKTNHY